MSTAYVLKEQVLETIEHRHATERAYQNALGEWQQAAANPEDHPQWAQFYANVLGDGSRKANHLRHETLAALTTADWRLLVYREPRAERWYVEPEVSHVPAPDVEEIERIPLAPARRNRNGVHLE